MTEDPLSDIEIADSLLAISELKPSDIPMGGHLVEIVNAWLDDRNDPRRRSALIKEFGFDKTSRASGIAEPENGASSHPSSSIGDREKLLRAAYLRQVDSVNLTSESDRERR